MCILICTSKSWTSLTNCRLSEWIQIEPLCLWCWQLCRQKYAPKKEARFSPHIFCKQIWDGKFDFDDFFYFFYLNRTECCERCYLLNNKSSTEMLVLVHIFFWTSFSIRAQKCVQPLRCCCCFIEEIAEQGKSKSGSSMLQMYSKLNSWWICWYNLKDLLNFWKKFFKTFTKIFIYWMSWSKN